jgi:hypothetical protein
MKIQEWAKTQGYKAVEERREETGYDGPDGSFLIINFGDAEAPFWNLYYPPGNGEHPDETGAWDETPNYDPR